jgi:hypothetical protein
VFETRGCGFGEGLFLKHGCVRRGGGRLDVMCTLGKRESAIGEGKCEASCMYGFSASGYNLC